MKKYRSLLFPGFLQLRWVAHILFILCATPAFLFSQEKYFAGNYYVENFGKEHGLPEMVVINVMQDRKGYIWISTPYFLVKYDGYNFKSYSLQKAFPADIVHTFRGMVEDKEGLIWVMTVQHGVIVFDPATEKFTRFQEGTGTYSLSGNFIGKIVKDEQERIWFSTPSGLNLVVKDQDKISFKSFGRKKSEWFINGLAGLMERANVIADATKLSNDKKIKQPFKIHTARTVTVIAEGESFNGDADFGWIENAKGDTLWRFQNENSMYAGGALKNRLLAENIHLNAGDYTLNFITDDSHAWGSWNDPPPVKEDWWGIRLVEMPHAEQSLDSLKHSLDNEIPRGENIKELIPVDGKLYAVTDAGIEILGLKEDSTLSGELVKLPVVNSVQINSFRLGKDALIIPFIFNLLSSEQIRIGFYRYHIPSGKLTRMADITEPENPYLLTGVYSENNGMIWVSRTTDYLKSSGLYQAKYSGDTIQFHHVAIAPPSRNPATGALLDQLWNIFPDRSGVLWVASRNHGLYKIHTSNLPFSNIPVNSGTDTSGQARPANILADGKGNTWLSYAGGNIVSYNRKSGTVRKYLLKNEGRFLFKDREGLVYASGESGVKKYDYAKNEFVPAPVKIPEGYVGFAIDSSGRFIAVKRSTDFRLIENGHAYPLVFDSSFRQFNFIRNAHIGRNNHIWMSTAFEGVDQYRWDEQQKKLVFVKKYLRMGEDVMDIYEDKDGILWLGTYVNGLVKIDTRTDSVKYYTIEDRLPSNGIWKIIPFDDELFIFSDIGTFYFEKHTGRVRKNNVLDYWMQKFTPVRYFFDNGLSESAVRSDPSGISMASLNGIATINTENLYSDTTPIHLQVSGLQIGKNHILFSDSLIHHPPVFNYDQNDISIEYIGLYYGMNHDLQYAYQLEGANADWVNTGTERVARFSNLLPGEYHFYLRVAQSQREWSAPQKMFSFTIRPPWWRTWWAYALYAIITVGGIWAYMSYRSRKLLEKNAELEEKVKERTTKLNQSLTDLKATQAQLIQSEKMASLGELTAGIAHEIQNPLNFVNNFSEVNRELLSELKNELAAKNYAEADLIADDAISNEEKIIHHGRRADSIIKGMLQHSRQQTGQNETVFLNDMLDEYLRLAYHGFRAKDKSFNCEMKTDFDPAVQEVSIIPQDMGRVFLNLFTNAFYSISQKAKTSVVSYKPFIGLYTERMPDKILITVKDNGNGIPGTVLGKIFQPFFTTKPTGEGTGLGLSLSYDIVKAHGGDIKVESGLGDGAVFTVILPA